MVAWSFDVQYLRGYIFMNLKHFCMGPEHIFHVQPIIFISSDCPLHTLDAPRAKFQYTSLNNKGQGVNKKYNFTNFKKSLLRALAP